MMYADARVRLHDGNSAAAADNIATLYRLATHLPADQMIVSSLVASTIFKGSDTIAETGFDHGIFNASDATAMLKALDGLKSNYPFDIVGAIRKNN